MAGDDKQTLGMVLTTYIAFVNLYTAVMFGFLVAYTTVYIHDQHSIPTGFTEFAMAALALFLCILTSFIAIPFYELFPAFKAPSHRLLTMGLWDMALGAFLIGDPLFIAFKDGDYKGGVGWVDNMWPMLLADAGLLCSCLVIGFLGFMFLPGNEEET